MKTQQKILFIINPISGTSKKENLPLLIEERIDRQKFLPEIIFTERAGHASEIAREAVQRGYSVVVAAGGDGTINETARELVNTDVALGIIPFGSGNGLARHLNIPLTAERALHAINKNNVISIDTGSVNNHAFFCTAGVGFDAHIGKVFAVAGKRGFGTYIRKCVNEFVSYKAKPYKLIFREGEIAEKAFLITFANTAQYGNNAKISPHADIQDGLLDICILSGFPAIYAVDLGRRLFTGSMDRSKFMKIVKTESVIVCREEAGPVHIDGEPAEMGAELTISILPSSLKVLV